jgi:hypothetical protein
MKADPEDLRDLTPTFTMLGGDPIHDPEGRLAR